MSKELEALEELESYINNIIFAKDLINHKQQLLADVSIIKQALQRLEAIENSKPSEAIRNLEALKDMLIGNGINDNINYFVEGLILPIKQALLKAQEQEKVLEVIKKKNVDIWLLKSCLTAEQYNFSITKIDNCKVFNLTKEEYNLLREVFVYD